MVTLKRGGALAPPLKRIPIGADVVLVGRAVDAVTAATINGAVEADIQALQSGEEPARAWPFTEEQRAGFALETPEGAVVRAHVARWMRSVLTAELFVDTEGGALEGVFEEDGVTLAHPDFECFAMLFRDVWFENLFRAQASKFEQIWSDEGKGSGRVQNGYGKAGSPIAQDAAPAKTPEIGNPAPAETASKTETETSFSAPSSNTPPVPNADGSPSQSLEASAPGASAVSAD